jgi:hypothetical protein
LVNVGIGRVTLGARGSGTNGVRAGRPIRRRPSRRRCA